MKTNGKRSVAIPSQNQMPFHKLRLRNRMPLSYINFHLSNNNFFFLFFIFHFLIIIFFNLIPDRHSSNKRSHPMSCLAVTFTTLKINSQRHPSVINTSQQLLFIHNFLSSFYFYSFSFIFTFYFLSFLFSQTYRRMEFTKDYQRSLAY